VAEQDKAGPAKNGPSESGKDLAKSARKDAQSAAATAQSDLEKVAAEAKGGFEHLKSEAASAAGEVRERAWSYATEQKQHAAAHIGGVASALRKVSDDLESEDETRMVARYGRTLAGGLDDLSETIKAKNLEDLMAAAESFGRRQPAAFLGAAALLGFAASRFAMASSTRAHDRGTGRGRSRNTGRPATGTQDTRADAGGTPRPATGTRLNSTREGGL